MKVRRDISSIPLRTAEGTWDTIVDLVTGEGTIDGDQFTLAATVIASLIADEAFQDYPLIMTGVSHRLVIYLRHGAEAMEAVAGVDELIWNPTAGDWRLYVPCADEDFDWAKKVLGERAPRFVVIKPGDAVGEEQDSKAVQTSEGLSVNWGAFSK